VGEGANGDREKERREIGRRGEGEKGDTENTFFIFVYHELFDRFVIIQDTGNQLLVSHQSEIEREIENYRMPGYKSCFDELSMVILNFFQIYDFQPLSELIFQGFSNYLFF
jgi:hypothetical protein